MLLWLVQFIRIYKPDYSRELTALFCSFAVLQFFVRKRPVILVLLVYNKCVFSKFY